MSSNKIHAGLPLVFLDALAPAFANGAGAASPGYSTDFIAATGSGGGHGNELRLPVFTAGTEDRVYTTTQIQHDLWIPSAGEVVFRPHVHWTFIAEPTAGRTVVWEWNYVVAKAGATFAATVTPATAAGAAIYTTTAAAEIRQHLITKLPDIVLPAADCEPSIMFIGALKLKSTSTVDAAVVGLLSFDLHYLAGPAGTDTEYV